MTNVSTNVNRAMLLANRVEHRTGDVDIEGVGTVTVRALSRWEFIQAGKLADDPMKQERVILAFAMVDPPMSEDDVAAWQKCSAPAEINAVARRVNELSGIGQGADKSNV